MEETYLMEDKDGFLVSVPASRLEQWQAAQERAEQNRPDAADSVRDRIRSEIVRRVYHTDTDE